MHNPVRRMLRRRWIIMRCPQARTVCLPWLGAIACLLAMTAAPAAESLRIGSKRFTESYILAEILTQSAGGSTPAEHRPGLGNTAILFQALRTGAIDLYPEYTGTIEKEILRQNIPLTPDETRRELAKLGLGMAVPLGFNNTYALAIPEAQAKRQGIATLSDLAAHPELRLGLSHEFLGRADGWPGLAQRYGLRQKPTGLDHGIAYEALAARQVDLIDIYATDAKIERLGLRVLTDDLRYFPRYDAVLLYRLDLPRRFPETWAALRRLEGRISAADMIAMNAAAELDGRSFGDVARAFLRQEPLVAQEAAGAAAQAPAAGLWRKLFDGQLWRLTRQHAMLVLAAVALAALAGIPLGVLAARRPRLRHTVMGVTGILQTIPSLALLAMLIPLLGTIGALPALVALFLYALLPVVRNTCTGIEQVPPGLRMAALALGLGARDRLLHIDIPLAMPVILAGVKTAAVMSVGTATIAAFIGAGGYGERIAIGLALNDNEMLLAGAIPAAALALATQFAFDIVEWHSRRGSHGAGQPAWVRSKN